MKYYALLVLIMLLNGCWETESGEKVGNVVKLGREGMFVKTNEAELIRGGMANGSGSFGEPFDFTIENEDVLQVIQYALENNKSVKIKYHKELLAFFRTLTVDNSFVDSAEII